MTIRRAINPSSIHFLLLPDSFIFIFILITSSHYIYTYSFLDTHCRSSTTTSNHQHNFIKLSDNLIFRKLRKFIHSLANLYSQSIVLKNIPIIKMQFSTLFLAAAAATLASAVKLTNSDFAVTAGSPFNITWSDAEGPVTLILKNGPSTALTTVSTIGSGLTGTSYSWTPSSSLDSDLYAIEIQDSTSTPNYSQQFPVSGATASASTVTASSTSASSASGSSTTGTSTGSSASESSTSSTSTGSSTGSSTSSSTGSSTASSTGSSTSNGTSTSASSSTTASGNSSTTLSGSSSASRTSGSSSRTASSSSTGGTSTSTSAPTSAAAEFASPLAFIFLAFAAIVTLN